MAWIGPKWVYMKIRLFGIGLVSFLVVFSVLVSAQESSQHKASREEIEPKIYVARDSTNSSQSAARSGYKHVWPDMKFGWKIIVGGIIGFLGAAFGSVGGVGGGGIFVPMLTLIIGFDEKSSTAISKCMVIGGAAATVFYNLRQRHPTLELPIIDYDLALLFQPMLMLGISLGVAFNVIFADWMIILLMIIVFLATSTKSFLKGIETWKKETIMKKEAAIRLQANGQSSDSRIPNSHQIPVTVGVTAYEAVSLYKGRRVIASKGEVVTVWSVNRLIICCVFGILAGMVGGLLGLGGGFIMGPLFLELGIPPQVSSATATLVMAFSSSMSVVEYYLLKRFPVPYGNFLIKFIFFFEKALYFAAVATCSALVGQHVVGKVISILGRASLIIFILSLMIFISALTLGGVGIAHTVEKIQNKEYMGFENICKS
ncbi:hypothetical protein TIFTF001_006641 [Ficus carica]|uniref:Sulfite exporter TauE/SafE family protein 3-like n=1 Tax=Ficus carica TaxID=3494 RepID=A0AA87ZRM2_FICCA|nr:hypothetical protein TIFTF001_006641 [Ficus carica]